ncbi:MAG: DNA translocase FtsK [Rhodanobacter sp.]
MLASFGDGPDPLLGKAWDAVRANGVASIATVQRHLGIGYNRSARLVEALEVQGRVSRPQSDGRRVIIG